MGCRMTHQKNGTDIFLHRYRLSAVCCRSYFVLQCSFAFCSGLSPDRPCPGFFCFCSFSYWLFSLSGYRFSALFWAFYALQNPPLKAKLYFGLTLYISFLVSMLCILMIVFIDAHLLSLKLNLVELYTFIGLDPLHFFDILYISFRS